MSFILDALKKSESDRQRRSGPALFEVKVAPPRTRLPLWAVAIVALLVVNLGIAMWMVLRHAPSTSTPAPTAAATAASVAPAAPTAPASPPAATAAPVAPAAPAGIAGPPAATAAATRVAAASAPLPATAATHTADLPAPAPAASVAGEPNPEDYAPAEDSASTRPANHVQRGTAAGVPLYQDAASTPGTRIPQLRLDLHVFAARPQDRFVMINMHKLREGDSLPEGVRLESITPEGAVLSYNGSRFLLPRQ